MRPKRRLKSHLDMKMLSSLGILIIKIRWSHDCLFFMLGISIPAKIVFRLKQSPGHESWKVMLSTAWQLQHLCVLRKMQRSLLSYYWYICRQGLLASNFMQKYRHVLLTFTKFLQEENFSLSLVQYSAVNSLAPERQGSNFTSAFFQLIFYKLISWRVPLKFVLGECRRTLLMTSQHWIR